MREGRYKAACSSCVLGALSDVVRAQVTAPRSVNLEGLSADRLLRLDAKDLLLQRRIDSEWRPTNEGLQEAKGTKLRVVCCRATSGAAELCVVSYGDPGNWRTPIGSDAALRCGHRNRGQP